MIVPWREPSPVCWASHCPQEGGGVRSGFPVIVSKPPRPATKKMRYHIFKHLEVAADLASKDPNPKVRLAAKVLLNMKRRLEGLDERSTKEPREAKRGE